MNKAKAVTAIISGVFACLYAGLSIADKNTQNTISDNKSQLKSLSNVTPITYTEPTYQDKAPSAIFLFGEYTVSCAPDFFHATGKRTRKTETEVNTVNNNESEETVTTCTETTVATTSETTAVSTTTTTSTAVATAPPVTEPAPAPAVTEAPAVQQETPQTAPVQEQPTEPVATEPVTVEPAVPVSEEEVQSQPEDTYSEPVIPISDAEYIMLCNAVAHEAGSSWIGLYEKAYVAEVIMNRVNSSLFPSTIYDVLTAPYQFTGAEDYVNLGYFTSDVTESVKEAVLLYFTEPQSFTQGYLYFYGDGTSNYFRQ